MKKILLVSSILVLAISILGCTAKTNSDEINNSTESINTSISTENIVNIYTDRHYDTDQELYDKFTSETGIGVNVVKAGSDELLERLAAEGEETSADLIITSDVGRLYRANENGLTKITSSDIIKSNVDSKYIDEQDRFVALTMRARIIAYSLDRVDPSALSTYEDLTDERWSGKVLVRSSSNIYNQSLLASFIELNGEEQAEKWASAMLSSMARDPEGNDRDQMKAVVAGEGDLAIVNTYYLGKLLNSSDPIEVEVGSKIGVFFPNQETNGTHINISGASLTKYGKNSENAIKLLEFLTGEAAQYQYANANFEYPVNPNVEPSDLLKGWGEFKVQDIQLSKLGELNGKAVEIFNKVGWK